MRSPAFLLAVILCVCVPSVLVVADGTYNVKVWKGYNTPHQGFVYPEHNLPDVMAKTNLAVCFSGGGTRAFTAAIGILRALHELQVMSQIRYIAGVSGGAYASIVYSLYNASATGTLGPENDDELLGVGMQPQELTLETLRQGCVRCALKASESNLWKALLWNAIRDGSPIRDIWTQSMGQLFLEPFGVHPRAIASWDNATLADLLSRNPSLAHYEPGFILQHPDRPFLVVGASLVGPYGLRPLSLIHRAFTKLCMTPLYVGSAYGLNVTYQGGGLFSPTSNSTESLGLQTLGETPEEKERRENKLMDELEILAQQADDKERSEEEGGMVGLDLDVVIEGGDAGPSSPLARRRSAPTRSLLMEKNKKKQHNKRLLHDQIRQQQQQHLLEVVAMDGGGDDATTTVGKSRKESDMVGGLVEGFAFGCKAPSAESSNKGMPAGATSGIVEVAANHPVFTVGEMISSSSWAPGALFAEVPIMDEMVNIVRNYWPQMQMGEGNTTTAPPSPPEQPFFLGDGGDEENLHGISMVMRGVRNLLFVFNCDTPLRPRSKFNPFERLPTGDDVEDDLSGYFGINAGGNPLYDISRNQMFNETDFPHVIDALQQAQAKGRGMVVTTQLETVDNDWFGLEGGIAVNVTWIYLTRALEFEALLPQEVRDLITPTSEPTDPSSLRTSGPFTSFPHFATISQFVLSAERANLLAHLTYWITMQHKDIILDALAAARSMS